MPKHTYILMLKFLLDSQEQSAPLPLNIFKEYLEFIDGVLNLSREIYPKSFILSSFTYPNRFQKENPSSFSFADKNNFKYLAKFMQNFIPCTKLFLGVFPVSSYKASLFLLHLINFSRCLDYLFRQQNFKCSVCIYGFESALQFPFCITFFSLS